MASRNRLLILVSSAISLSEIPRISRSRFSSSPKVASSECAWGSWSAIGPGILFNSLDMRREIVGLHALDAAAEIGRSGWIGMDQPAVFRREEAELRSGRGAGRRGVQHERLPYRVS